MLTRAFTEDFSDLRRSLDQFFENFYSFNPRRTANGASANKSTFSPTVESGWTDEYLNLRVIVPGVDEKDLKLTVQGNQLYLEGERRAPENFGKEGYVWNQIPYGKFERVLDLPSGLDLDKMQAHLHHGFLDIRIPVASAMKPRSIPIAAEQKTIAA